MQTVESTCIGVDGACEYRPELATLELIGEVRRLLAMGQRIEHLVCRYLAELADRIRQGLDGALWAYADEVHAARCFFGLGVRDTRERVRVGRALRELPRIEAAFARGDLSYSRVREVTRVAEPETETGWLELARSLDMRSLERRVAAAREGSVERGGAADVASNDNDGRERGGLDKPARTEWLTQNAVRVTFELSATAWGLLERALEGARHAGGSMSDAEALLAVARDALSAQTENPDASDPRCAVVVFECQRCGQSELDTGGGLLELAPAAAATVGCGMTEIELASEGRGVQRGGALPAATRRAVMLRDRCRCRVPGCSRRRYVDVHHLVPQADGGAHSRSNCFVLCRTHHHLLHDGKLEVTGDAEGELCFRDARGEALVDVERFPTSVGAPAEPDEGATQGGILQEPAARVLHVIGRRGGWSLDALIEGSGLPASAVSSALTLLELGGRVRYRDFVYDPV